MFYNSAFKLFQFEVMLFALLYPKASFSNQQNNANIHFISLLLHLLLNFIQFLNYKNHIWYKYQPDGNKMWIKKYMEALQ